MLPHCCRQNEAELAEDLQRQSLQVLYENNEPEDMESEDVPWEVFKRLKQQRGPSTAANSILLFKGNLRKTITDVMYKPHPNDPASPADGGNAFGGDQSREENAATPTDRRGASPLRALRSKSDSAMRRLTGLPGDGTATSGSPSASDLSRAPIALATTSRSTVIGPRDGQSDLSEAYSASLRTREAAVSLPEGQVDPPSRDPPPRVRYHQCITDFATLQQRVEHLKRRVAAGLPDSDDEISQFTSDVSEIQSPDLQQVGYTMVSLVTELHRLRLRSDAVRQLPVLEGVLEKKSASIFRGWEKRWFKVDAKTFVLSYHFSKDDESRGFAPRGGFAISRIANIVVHRQPRGSFFHFDVIVDLSTRSNPHGSRTYELRCEDDDTLRYWVDTLHYYKTLAQTSPPRPSTG